MSTNMNAGQPRLYTFAEMGYITQNPQDATPATQEVKPAAQEKGDTVTIFGKKVSKKKAGIGAAIATIAVLALATFGFAHSGKKINLDNGIESGFVKNLQTGLLAGWAKLKALPGEIWARIKGNRETISLDEFDDYELDV